MHRCLLLFIHFLLIFLELFRSPLLVSGTNYHATSRLRHPVCEFTAVVWRLVFSAFPFLSFSSACEREVTSVVIGYFNRFLLTYLLTYLFPCHTANADFHIDCSLSPTWRAGNTRRAYEQESTIQRRTTFRTTIRHSTMNQITEQHISTCSPEMELPSPWRAPSTSCRFL